jgi:hypothetical protein
MASPAETCHVGIERGKAKPDVRWQELASGDPQGGMSIDTEGRDEVKAAFKYKRCRKWI